MPESPDPNSDAMDSGWSGLAKAIVTTTGKPMLVVYDTAMDWGYRNLLFSRHERETRKTRRSQLLDMRTDIKRIRTQGVEWYREDIFMFDGQGRSPFRKLADQLAEIGVSGPQRDWGQRHHPIRPECLIWLDRLLYACKIRSLRTAVRAWKHSLWKHEWNEKLAARK